MQKIMTKIPIWLLMVWPYIFLGGLFLGGSSFFGIFCILSVVLCVMNVINARTYQSENIAKDLGLWGMIIKLVHMPFYVVALMLGLIGMLSMTAQPAGGNALFMLSFIFIMSMVLMIQSSLYCVKAVFASQAMGIVKKEIAMMLATTSFILFADVICAILIYNKIKKNKKQI